MKAGIVGAGIMGRLIAFYLVNAGWQVTLFDHNDSDNCSMSAAGLLTPVSELEKSDPIIFNLGIDALDKYWISILSTLSPIYFQRNGSLILTHPRDTAELFRFSDHIHKKIHKEIYCELTRNEIINLECELTRFETGLYLPLEGQLDNQALLKSLKDYLIHKKITWENAYIHEINPGEVRFNNITNKYDIVFDCRGLNAKSSFHDLRGVRGELIWVCAPHVNIQRPIRLLHPRYSLYIAPRPENIYILGASEIESDDLSAISVRTTLELLSAANYMHPGFAEARIIKSVVNCRPTLSHHLPKIKYTGGLIAINGLYRHGFLVAPTLANEVMTYLRQGFGSVKYPELWETAVVMPAS